MGGKRKGRKVTVGYRYFWDIHSGLGRGPVDEIVEIRFDDKTAYVGKPGELTYSQAILSTNPIYLAARIPAARAAFRGAWRF